MSIYGVSNNPRGKRVQASNGKIECTSRKQRCHEKSTKAQSGKEFTEMRAGGTTAVHWTLFEKLVLMQIILALLAREQLDPETLCQQYNHLVSSVSITTVKHCLGKKTVRQV